MNAKIGKWFGNERVRFGVVAGVIYGYMVARVMKAVVEGSVPFWYDPARDLMAGAANLEKFSLLGPPTGVPGLFYGPYWIWLLSIGVGLFRDPRWVLLLVQTLPYLLVFPWLLGKWTRVWGKWVSLWVFGLFSIAGLNYFLFLWNPHLAPLMFLGLGYLVIEPDSYTGRIRREGGARKLLAMGFLAGLMVNFHFSFGVAVVLATGIWLLSRKGNLNRSSEKMEKRLTLFAAGLALVFTPFMAFEARHGFNQTKVLAQTVEGAYWNQETTVGMEGISKLQVWEKFWNLPGMFLEDGNRDWIVGIWLAVGSAVGMVWKKRRQLTGIEKDLAGYVVLVVGVLMVIYLGSGNPIWEYHFIGVEMVMLVGFGLLAGRVRWFRWLMAGALAVLMIGDSLEFGGTFRVRANQLDSLTAKREVVETVIQDAGNEEFAFSAYTPAVYIPDYEYLLGWLSEKNGARWIRLEGEVGTVYLVLPWTEEHVRLDFLNYKTPNEKYETVKEWQFPSGIRMYKRVKLE